MPRKRRVRLTGDALADLAEIGDYIALDNRRRAKSFVRELRDACLALADMAERFPIIGGQSDYRRRPHGNYVIYYVVEADTVVIMRIWSAARDARILLPDD